MVHAWQMQGRAGGERPEGEDAQPNVPVGAALELHHRLFPRAMAWRIQQQTENHLDDDMKRRGPGHRMPPQRSDSTESDEWSTATSRDDDTSGSSTDQAPAAAFSEPWAMRSSHAAAATVNLRPSLDLEDEAIRPTPNEEIFMKMGKWLGRTNNFADASVANGAGMPSSDNPPPPPPPPSMNVPAASAERSAFSWEYLERRQAEVHVHAQIQALSVSDTSSVTTNPGRKRSRPQPTTAPVSSAKPGSKPGGCGAKRCSVDGCEKIAVSKHLCRGHGGGRRCQFPACGKCAQSRSPFCWAHGGGKRCEAPGCRRSRKTKHFCVDHVDMELTYVPSSESTPTRSATPPTPSEHDVEMEDPHEADRFRNVPTFHAVAPHPHPLHQQLPSLHVALKRVLATTNIPAALTQSQQQQPGTRRLFSSGDGQFH
ncbi:TPA: hypothetical protein N0F65_001677 [Lagenidium giganteum]|uniref:WRKY19-like zinc finger domain-containing protein n=1 Tax=Lagenidium giganteum TaxID=4803 RepID=A0AAV2Z2A0_9STRA|nr:TPA: hypothetical protein N0F65_001677 [Lagenidium giganteum]